MKLIWPKKKEKKNCTNIQSDTTMCNFKINNLFGEDITLRQKCDSLTIQGFMNLLNLVLNIGVFLFQGKIYHQLPNADMGSLFSPIVVNIYIEYFKETALNHTKCPNQCGTDM